ncbi:MAG: hypothetical protein ACI8UZ_002191 [Akkermansiaceae bacterium]|jgi:hypothetical protein
MELSRERSREYHFLMNKNRLFFVQFSMRVAIYFIGVSLLFTSCSSSRTVDAERIVEPGSHSSRSVLGSDVLVRKGSVLDVSFSKGNRFYVASGGVLTGFQAGSRNTRIYAEAGAYLPEKIHLSRTKVMTVPSVEKAFRNRFEELPPLRGGSSGGGGSSSLSDDDDDDWNHRDRRSKAISAKPASYKSKN